MYLAHIDYLTLTRVYPKNPVNSAVMSHWGAESVASDIISSLAGTCGILKKFAVPRFYAYAFEDQLTGAVVSLGADVTMQGVKVTFSGRSLNRIDSPDYTLKIALRDGWKVTRLDLAIDALGEGHLVSDYSMVYGALYGDDKQRTWSRLASPTGETLYIGSRTSARMLRVYDKGAEQKLSLDWIRFEIEFKDYLAPMIADAWLMDHGVIYTQVLSMLGMPEISHTAGLMEMGRGTEDFITTKPRTRSNRVLWFQTQVVAAFEKIVHEDPLEAIECLAAIEEVLLEQYEVWMGNR